MKYVEPPNSATPTGNGGCFFKLFLDIVIIRMTEKYCLRKIKRERKFFRLRVEPWPLYPGTVNDFSHSK